MHPELPQHSVDEPLERAESHAPGADTQSCFKHTHLVGVKATANHVPTSKDIDTNVDISVALPSQLTCALQVLLLPVVVDKQPITGIKEQPGDEGQCRSTPRGSASRALSSIVVERQGVGWTCASPRLVLLTQAHAPPLTYSAHSAHSAISVCHSPQCCHTKSPAPPAPRRAPAQSDAAGRGTSSPLLPPAKREQRAVGHRMAPSTGTHGGAWG